MWCASDGWYVAAMNGGTATTPEVPLDFLGSKNRGWRLREFADGDDPAAPETVLETIRELGNTRSLSLPLQPDGGYAAVVNPK